MYDRDKLDEITEAKKRISEGSLVIWRTRLEVLVNTGNVRGAFRFLGTPTEPAASTNNCTNNAAGCGGDVNNVPGCGAPPPDDTITSLPPPPRDTNLPGVND